MNLKSEVSLTPSGCDLRGKEQGHSCSDTLTFDSRLRNLN